MTWADAPLKAKETDRKCDRCQSLHTLLRRNVSRNGTNHFFWYCPTCDRPAKVRGGWIKHDTVNRWVEQGRLPSVSSVPIQNDYRGNEVCAVCGSPASEDHHWAPQALAEFFGAEWHKWPTTALCRKHHVQWHSIVSWYLPGETDPKLAQAVVDKWAGEGMWA